ncbi:MAG: transposase [Pirellulaceae bacterium]|nr:transposase [Pirellulaceae bacterium]
MCWGYVAYERIGELWPGVFKASCWVHARRKFEACHHLGWTISSRPATAPSTPGIEQPAQPARASPRPTPHWLITEAASRRRRYNAHARANNRAQAEHHGSEQADLPAQGGWCGLGHPIQGQRNRGRGSRVFGTTWVSAHFTRFPIRNLVPDTIAPGPFDAAAGRSPARPGWSAGWT